MDNTSGEWNMLADKAWQKAKQLSNVLFSQIRLEILQKKGINMNTYAYNIDLFYALSALHCMVQMCLLGYIFEQLCFVVHHI